MPSYATFVTVRHQGQTLGNNYIFEEDIVRVGSKKKCEMRLLYPYVEGVHLILSRRPVDGAPPELYVRVTAPTSLDDKPLPTNTNRSHRVNAGELRIGDITLYASVIPLEEKKREKQVEMIDVHFYQKKLDAFAVILPLEVQAGLIKMTDQELRVFRLRAMFSVLGIAASDSRISTLDLLHLAKHLANHPVSQG